MKAKCHGCNKRIEIKTVPIQTVVCPKCGEEFTLQIFTPVKREG